MVWHQWPNILRVFCMQDQQYPLNLRFDPCLDVPKALRSSVVALGNFDGFHKGHQVVIGRAAQLAKTMDRPLAVLSFNPHPARLFQPDLAPFGLTSADQKQALLTAFGVDGVLLLPFTKDLASLTSHNFVETVLKGHIGASHVVCGYDFTFGQHRSGKAEDLSKLGIGATIVQPVMLHGQTELCSSTHIRQRLIEGAPDKAAEMMGRWWQIEAVVEQGDKQGRLMGFPTVNLSMGEYQRPAYGVYAVRVHVAGTVYDGVANIGLRPTFNPPRERLEVHLFNFSCDIYDEKIAVDFVAFIRSERRFENVELLKAQIAVDRATADKILRQPAFAYHRFKPVTRAQFED
jgi:riboflavin kinase / FMN adenylyltransferase